MAIEPNGNAPYAPGKTITDIIDTYRNHTMRKPFDLDVLMQAGVSESLAPRTLQALKLLDIIDASGMPTPQFEALSAAPEAEFKSGLADLFCSAYRDVLNFADPATHDQSRIRDAFRPYTPRGQQERMVTLFLALMEYAGMDVSAAKPPVKTKKDRPAPPKKKTPVGSKGKNPADRSKNGRAGNHRHDPPPPPPPSESTYGLPVADLALLSDEDFDVVWDALGRVAKARAKEERKKAQAPESPATKEAP